VRQGRPMRSHKVGGLHGAQSDDVFVSFDRRPSRPPISPGGKRQRPAPILSYQPTPSASFATARPPPRDGVPASFPGPGWGWYLGEVKRNTPICCAAADAIFIEEPARCKGRPMAWLVRQGGAGLCRFPPGEIGGVMGDGRTYEYGRRSARRADHRLYDCALGAPAARTPRQSVQPHHE